jgi:carbon-monoxide dehydrogenase medium subunit
MTATDPFIATHIPVVHHAMKHVAHLTVRNRGTFCGSVCHADPAAEMPMMTLLLNGIIHIASASHRRTVDVKDFFIGSLITALEPDELVTGIEIETPAAGTGWSFEEFSRRHGDYALAAAAVTMRWRAGSAHDVRIGLMGVSDMPLRLSQAEAFLEGSEITDAKLNEAIEVLRAAISPNSDNNASSDFRRHLAGVLAGRALKAAWASALEGRPA